MAHKGFVIAFSLVAAAAPAWATKTEPAPVPAPMESADARYCMRLEPMTGTRLELIRCWTRDEWAEEGVDVDKDWAENGVAVLKVSD